MEGVIIDMFDKKNIDANINSSLKALSNNEHRNDKSSEQVALIVMNSNLKKLGIDIPCELKSVEEILKFVINKSKEESSKEIIRDLNNLGHHVSNLEDIKTILNKGDRAQLVNNIYNRDYFEKLLIDEEKNAIQSKSPLSLLMLDIDFFKSINDKYGHTIGDEAIKAIVSKIEEVSLQKDIKKLLGYNFFEKVARWGGEEFAILLPNTTSEVAFIIAERIRKTIADYEFKINIKDKKDNIVNIEFINITVTLGVACDDFSEIQGNNHTATYHSGNLVERADSQLIFGKNNGRNRVQVEDKNPFSLT